MVIRHWIIPAGPMSDLPVEVHVMDVMPFSERKNERRQRGCWSRAGGSLARWPWLVCFGPPTRPNNGPRHRSPPSNRRIIHQRLRITHGHAPIIESEFLYDYTLRRSRPLPTRRPAPLSREAPRTSNPTPSPCHATRSPLALRHGS